jgi:hypothetical protein
MQDKEIVAVNLKAYINHLLSDNKAVITDGMNAEQVRAYELGITNCFSALDSIFQEDAVFVLRNHGPETEEISILEMLKGGNDDE